MTTRIAIWTDDPVHSRTVPIDDNARVALGLLSQAYTLREMSARKYGTLPWRSTRCSTPG